MIARIQFRFLVCWASGQNVHRILESPLNRMRLLQTLPFVLIVAGAALVFERPAYAYADPGTGLLAVQAAGSALVATGWYLRRKIYSLFRSGEAPSSEPEERSVAADGEDSPNP
jgi:hypothetical protein